MASARVERIIGVYDADGGVMGELRYALRRVFRGQHCTLCEITHRGIKAKPEWSAWAAAMPVPVEVVHLDERDDALRAATEGRTPCVVGESDGHYTVLLDRDELAACDGEVQPFALRLDQALGATDLGATDFGATDFRATDP